MNPKRWVRWLGMAACVIGLSLLFGVSPARSAPSKMWVAVMEDSTDACILKTAERFGEVLAVAKFNEQVEIIRDLMDDEANPRPFFRIKTAAVTGYIKRNALAEKSQYQGERRDSEASVAVGASAANTAAKGLNHQNEATLRKNDPNFDKCVNQVEVMEKAINESVTGSGSPSPQSRMGSYQSWASDGQNLPQDQPKDSGKDG
jgi:hypothetical protein